MGESAAAGWTDASELLAAAARRVVVIRARILSMRYSVQMETRLAVGGEQATWRALRGRLGACVAMLAFALCVTAARAQQPSNTASAAAQSPAASPTAKASAAAAPADAGDAGEWPRKVSQGGVKFTVYQPQLTSWDGYRFKATAAVVVEGDTKDTQIFGAVDIDATALVNKDERTVFLEKVHVTSARFPSVKDKAEQYRKLLDAAANKADADLRTIELDRLEASLDIATSQGKSAREVRNTAPRILFAREPSLLIYIDGTPVWQAIPKTSLERVINMRPLLVRTKGGPYYLKVFDGWLQSKAFDSAWTVVLQPPAELEQVLKAALEAKAIDPLSGTSPNDPKATPPSLKVDAPKIVVAMTPTELIVTQGEPKYVPVPDTSLLYVENTTGNVFKHTRDQNTYVLIAGRWFKAASDLGPWTFVAGAELPKDFSRIPDNSPKENVKASVPGTPQAEEAVIANSIPQTAKVDRKQATFKPQFDGEPRLEPIETTSLYRVVNSATPIIKVNDSSFYAVENGVWFTAPALTGPWVVATSIPTVIYSIPASSPVYIVTYVVVYDVTPTYVVVGYTPGYYSTYVSNGCVVYGTGYAYTPWVGSVWYGPPVTYGFGVNIAYTPWTGWVFGFGYGWSWGYASMSYGGWGWGPYPWWGPVGYGFYGPAYYPWGYRPGYGAVWGPRPGSGAVWGPGGWAASSGNVYHRWGATTAVTRSSAGFDAWSGNSWSHDVGRSYNSRTGTLSAGQRSSVGNIYTGNYRTSASGAAVNERTGGAAVAGKVTRGNAYTGNQVTAGAAAVRDPRTGQVTTAAGVRGENGAAVRIGDDVYVGSDGNVARRNGDGDWQRQTDQGEWSNVDRASRDRAELDRSQQQRQEGSRRYDGYSRGARQGAGVGGGGFRRGGGGRR